MKKFPKLILKNFPTFFAKIWGKISFLYKKAHKLSKNFAQPKKKKKKKRFFT